MLIVESTISAALVFKPGLAGVTTEQMPSGPPRELYIIGASVEQINSDGIN